jgi:hypothetical protein
MTEITYYYEARISHHIPHAIEYLLFSNGWNSYVSIEGIDYQILFPESFQDRKSVLLTGAKINEYGAIHIAKYAPDNHYQVIHHFYVRGKVETCPPMYLKSPVLGELLYYIPILQRLYL